SSILAVRDCLPAQHASTAHENLSSAIGRRWKRIQCSTSPSADDCRAMQPRMNTVPPLRRNPQLYEISTLQWLSKLSQKLGRRVRLGDIPVSEWGRLQSLGFDLVYLMGIWKRSAAGRLLSRGDLQLMSRYDEALPGWKLDDVAGSPFSVEAYEPDPLIGSWNDLQTVRHQLHDVGIRLIL